MASAYGYAPMLPIYQHKLEAPLSPIHQQNSILLKKNYSPIVKGDLEIFYNEKIIPGGQIPNGPVFSEFIEQPLNITHPKIGEGSFGDVYLLTFGDQQYVLKSIILNSPIAIQHVKQEIYILVNLIGNPFAVQLLGSIIKYKSRYSNGEYKTGTAYLLYPFIPGMTLEEYQKRYPSQTKESIDIFEKIIDAVQELHLAGILHSDIKPDNIWIPDDRTKSPFLLDFGASQTLYNTDGPVKYTRPVGAWAFWSDKRMRNTHLAGQNYPMTTGINWIALAKTFGYNDNYKWNIKESKSVSGQSPLNRNGLFKKLANMNNESTLTYKGLKNVITKIKNNVNPPSGGRRHTKRNKQKRNKRTRQNKKIKKRN